MVINTWAGRPPPRFGLGMAALGRPGYINLDRTSILGTELNVETMQRHANLVMDRLFALSADVVWLDVARSYGLSEKFVGENLRHHQVSPEQVYVVGIQVGRCVRLTTT